MCGDAQMAQNAAAAASAAVPSKLMNRALVERGAAWLRSELGLRLFGFDIVVDQSTGMRTVTLLQWWRGSTFFLLHTAFWFGLRV